jgi:tetratricopeptide (TPR) repeat protein
MEILMTGCAVKGKARLIALAVGAVLLASSLELAAQEKPAAGAQQQAKEHFLKGKALFDEGAYEKAIIELKASYDLNPKPIVLYNIATCYDRLTKYADAVKYYGLFLEKAGSKLGQIKKEVDGRIAELRKFLGILELKVDVDGAEVIIDDHLAGLTPLEMIPIETGEHDLKVRKIGYNDIDMKFTIVSDKTTSLSFVMNKIVAFASAEKAESEKGAAREARKKAEKARKKKIHPACFWSLVGLTGASAVAFAVTGALVWQKDTQINEYTKSQAGWKPLQDEGKKLALATDILIGVSAAAAVSALAIFFFTDFKKSEKKPAAFILTTDGRAVMMGYGKNF